VSPEQNGITFGAPTERRKFLDLVIAQASRVYLQDLLEFRRILRQRNKVLLDEKLLRRDLSDVREPWDRALIETGSAIMVRRSAFLREFGPRVIRAYEIVAGGGEEPGVSYEPSFACSNGDGIEAVQRAFEAELRSKEDEERRAGATTVGPHRDEVHLTINGTSVRKFASQGQHKTLLIALKLAEVETLKEHCGETPLLLLDDVFSELDRHRAAQLIEHLETLGQVIVTATDLRAFPRTYMWSGANGVFDVSRGSVTPRTPKTGKHHAFARTGH
jgi:DNA replication and repair protein RecF